VLAAIGSDPTSIDQVVADSGLPAPRALSTISVLEMRRLVRRLSGSTVERTLTEIDIQLHSINTQRVGNFPRCSTTSPAGKYRSTRGSA
jgi:hypothetical protein